MNFLKNLFMGVFIGMGAIVPGVSSGVICVIMGIYEELLNRIVFLFKDLKNNLKYLLPVAIGIIIGMITFGRILNFLLYKYPIQIKFTFIGLVLGSIPAILKKIEKKEEYRFRYMFYMIVSMLIGFGMIFLENRIMINSCQEFSFIYLIFAGICMSIGVVVPGVSSTIILMLLGVYSAYLTSISNLYIPILIPIGIGIGIGSLICIKIIKFLMDNYYIQTFYSIIGFTIGSVFVLYPGISFDLTGVVSVLCFLLGCIIQKSLEK